MSTFNYEDLGVPEPNTGCYLFGGGLFNTGYGRVRWLGKQRLAHRVSFEAHIGPVLDGLCVCHKCDTKSCINPAHLFLGTQADNNADRVAKGRSAPAAGSYNGRARLTEEAVERVRALIALGQPQAEIARGLGVSPKTINGIATGRTWKNLTDKRRKPRSNLTQD